MGWRARWLQAVGLALFLATALLPVHGPCERPGRAAGGDPTVRLAPDGREGAPRPPAAVPAAEICTAAARDLAGSSPGSRLWEVRRWYPYALAPLWLLALLLVRGPSGTAQGARRTRVGTLLLGVSVAVAILEARYLGEEYAVLFPEVLGRSEVVIAWLLVVAILVWRRPRDRALGAVEGHVASQALLSFVHMLTLPSSEMRPWLGHYPLRDVLTAVLTNFHPAFWLGCVGLAVGAGAAYLSGGAPNRSAEPVLAPGPADAGAASAATEPGLAASRAP